MNKDEKILINSDGESQRCSDYKNGYCKSTGKMCDACYENSIKMLKDGGK